MPQPVLDAVIAHLQREARIGGYEAAEEAQDAIEHVYDAVAALIGCARDEVAIIENATRAWDMAFYSIPFRAGERILTSMAEYASNYIAYLQVAQRTGAIIQVIPNDAHGQISVEALRNAIDERVKLISVTHVPTNGGLVNPVAEVGKIAREAGILYLVDACQSVGQMPIDVGQIGCDLLSAHRVAFRSGLWPSTVPRAGRAWAAGDRYEMRPDARRFENWETNYAAKIGLGVAIDYALQWNIPTTWRRIKNLAYTL